MTTINVSQQTIDKLKPLAKHQGWTVNELIENILHFVAHGSVIARTDGRIEIPREKHLNNVINAYKHRPDVKNT